MANWFGSALRSAGDAAGDLGKNIGETTSNLTTAAGKQASRLGKSVSQTASSLGDAAGKSAGRLGKSVSQTASGLVQTLQGWLPFSSEDTLAFLAVLFAVAAADNQIDEAELNLILSSPEASQLSAKEKQILQTYKDHPPALETAIKDMADADAELKFGLIFCILNLIRINGSRTPAEEEALKLAQQELKISDAQLKAIEDFIEVMDQARNSQNEAAKAEVSSAIENMKAVGVPVDALTYAHSEAEEMDYSDDKFIEKMKTFGQQAGQKLVEQAFIMWYTLHAPQTPISAKLTIAGALAYWILPVDLIPDVLPAVGFTDDFTTIASAMTSIAMSITPEIRAKAKHQTAALFAGEEVFDAESVSDLGSDLGETT